MRRALLLAAAILLPGSLSAQTIFIAGDSTATDRLPAAYPEMGWGMMLPCGLVPGVKVDNRAIAGRSTKTFIGEGRLDRILGDLARGDVVLIQFGHNDASLAKPERHVEPEPGFRNNLQLFVDRIRASGGTPVLLTPVTRRSFENGKAKADFAPYSAVTRSVAKDMNVPLIDLESLSRAWLDAQGIEGSKRFYLHYSAADGIARWPKGKADDTHFSELGARRIADLVAGALRDLGLPVSRFVLAERRDLLRSEPLGKAQCH